MSPSDPCVFCEIVKGNAPAEIVADGARWVAFGPLNPHVPGHLLFVPRVHVRSATDHPKIATTVFEAAARYAAEHLGDVNILTSVGAAATQTVEHLHIHVLPRGERDDIPADWPWQRDLHRSIWETTAAAVNTAYGTDDRHGYLGMVVADAVAHRERLPMGFGRHFGSGQVPTNLTPPKAVEAPSTEPVEEEPTAEPLVTGPSLLEAYGEALDRARADRHPFGRASVLPFNGPRDIM